MADNLGINTGAGGPVAADEISSVFYQRIKLIHGADGVNAGDVSDANPLPIDDAGGSITVDNAQLSVVGGGTEAAAMRVTIANNSTGVLSVDDNGGALTIDSAQFPSTLGQKSAANSFAVVLPSDQVLQAGQAFKWVSATSIGMTAITYQGEDVVGSLQTLADVTTTKAFRLENITVRARHSGTVKDYMLIFFAIEPTSSTFTNGDTVSINTADKNDVMLMQPINDTDFVSVGAGGNYFASASINVQKVLFSLSGDTYMVVIAKEEVIGTADSLEVSIGVTQDG